MTPTRLSFLDDAYLNTSEATVISINDRNGIILENTIFYATSGGQPGDSGHLELNDGSTVSIATTVKGENGQIIHVPDEGQTLPNAGDKIVAHINWERRYKLMRMHTACHLLSVVCPYPITSANVGENESRIDFDIPDAGMDKKTVSEAMMELVHGNHAIYDQWIDEAELDANPDLVKSKNVKPPRGVGSIRLVCIGENSHIDSQPCGGTHVSETAEVGEIHIGKIEKKGRENRRFRIRFGPFPDA